jgi:DNA-binding PadR family transcriptional regulator
MLSKVGALVMGIIKENPRNPYEITKLLEIIKIKEWFPVAASSVYATIRTLHGKGYIEGEAMKEGSMPEKTVYTITEEGRLAFEQTVRELLSAGGLDSVAFNIGTVMMCHLEKREVLELLESKVRKIEKELDAVKKQYAIFVSGGGVPDYALISLKHNEYLYEAEIRTTLELIEMLHKNPSWNHFLSKAEA